MKLQVLKDNFGNQTGVYIPAEEWTLIKQQYPDIEYIDQELPQWQKDIVLERLHNPQGTMDAFEMIDDLENEKI